jgi:hypothetical protein
MTVSSTTTSVSYTGDAATTSFAVTFPFLGTGASSELTVVERTIATGAESTQTYTTDYTVTGGSGNTGTVIAGSAPASTVEWHIRRNTTTTQATDYVTNDPFAADTFELSLDRLAMAGQERDGDLAQAFKYPDTYTGGGSVTFPEPVANAYLLYNAGGTALTTSTTAAGQSLGGDGTVSLPFYSFSADPNTGIYRIGADNLAIAAGGSKIVDINASGLNAAIGQTTAAAGAFSTLTASGTTTFTGVTTHGGNVVSDSDSTDDLGTTGVRWANLWVDDITMTNDLTVGNDLTVTGNLTINGTTVTNDATNLLVKDPLIGLNQGAASNASDLGLLMERGSTGDNGFFGWDESGDFFAVGTTTGTADSTGNLTYSFAPFKCSALTATSGTLAGLTSFAMSAGATITAGVLDEDDMSSDSAVALATQQSIKAYADSNARPAGIQMTWESLTTDTDQGVGKVWANHGTLSSATVLYFDDVENNSVSINSFIDSLDDPTATNSATIYISEGGAGSAGVVYQVNGAVTSASTYSKVAVTHVATYGTLTDGDLVGVVIAFSGDNGAINNIVEDTTPQLGGDLDLNGHDITGMVIGTDVQAYDADTLKADTDDVLTAGFGLTDDDDGTKTTGTYTPIYTGGNGKKIVNGGAFTLAPMAASSNLVVQVTNNASAGAVTTSGWTKLTGDDLTTTDGDDFMLYCTRINSFTHLHIVALQ